MWEANDLYIGFEKTLFFNVDFGVEEAHVDLLSVIWL